jgi:putative hydrolase of the HAD superfamily
MILIFDLDDTLYSERSFVVSGFAAVAEMLEDLYGWDKSASLSEMLRILAEKGRGAVFNELLAKRQRQSAGLVRRCLHTYRFHKPNIVLNPEAKALLESKTGSPMYLVTDGNKIVQANKVRALMIEKYFLKVFITHRYGIRNAKPSVYCFDLIRQLERCSWNEMAYIGDNPRKDFVNLTPLGVLTIRVMTGEYANVNVLPKYDAKFNIPSIGHLQSVLNGIAA